MGPWRPGEPHSDRSRQLPVLDPDGRSLLLSCGAALELARLGLAARGWRTDASRLPDPDQPDQLARIRPLGLVPTCCADRKGQLGRGVRWVAARWAEPTPGTVRASATAARPSSPRSPTMSTAPSVTCTSHVPAGPR